MALNLSMFSSLLSLFSLQFLIIGILITSTISQKNCDDLQNNNLIDGDTITLTEKCIINTTSIINLANDISITIIGANDEIQQIEFITTQQYLFQIMGGASLSLVNIEIESPKEVANNETITSIFYLSQSSSLTLNNVQFKNNIIDTDDYLYTDYIIYSPESNASSSITIIDSTFDANFAVLTDAIYIHGTKNGDDCSTSKVSIENTIYNEMSIVL